MSDVVEKTLIALPSLLSLDSQPGAGKLSATSKLGTLIKSITELTSRHEEEKLIKKELAAIKEQVSSPNTSLRQMKEVMVRSIYCEMLGYEASFSYIHAIKLAQQGSVLEKRVGYLAVSLFLNESHNLLLLLVNTVLKDLQSTNLTEVCMALTVVSQVFPKDMIPAVLPLVEDKLMHSKEIIRRKAVLALYKFYLIAPNQVQHIHDKFRRALCDKDPGVMTASLHIYLQLIKESPSSYRDLTESFVAILKQVVGGKLPVDFNYHSVPAPWLQMQLLRILALLGKEAQSTSELMYDLLDESLRRAEMNHNITYAILYECVKTIYTIYPKSELLEKAAKCIGKFILSPKINLKYLGLKALTYVVQQDPNLALQHQMTIIECLDHPEPIVKRETLELLYRITNAQNVSIIVEKMLDFLRSSKEEYTTIDLVGKVAELAEKFAPDNSWFIQIMNSVFSMGGDVMQPEIPNNFLRLLAEGFDSAEEDTKLRLLAVDSYLSLLDSDPALLPQRFLQVISWVLGEFSHLKVGLDPVLVHARLAALLSQGGVTTETQCWVLAAMSKLPVAGGAEPAEQRCAVGLDTTLRQLATEMQVLSKNADLKARVLPREGRSVDLEVDSSLSFLDGFVSDALARGAAPYKPPHQRQEELSQGKLLNFEPYGMSLPISLTTCSLTDRHSPTALSVSSSLSGPSTDLPHKASSNGLKLEGVKRVWGKEGYLPQKETAVEIEGVVDSCPVESFHQQGGSESKTAGFSTAAQQEQERRQLASSLFVGLGSQDALCLMGKPEPRKQRFRRRAKAEEPSGTSEKGSDFYLDQLWNNPAPESMAECPPGELTSPSSHARESCPSVGETTGGSEEGANSDAMGVKDRPPRDSSLVHHLPAELSGLLRSEIVLLCSAESLSVHACRVYKDDALELIIFLSNTCTSSILEVSFSLTSAHLQVFGGPADLLEELGTSGVAVIRHRLLMESPTAQTVTVDGRASYRSKHQEPCVLTFSVPLSLTDFIRPLRVSTEEYGRMWLSFSHDVKQNLKLLVDKEEPLTATLSALRQKLQLHLVEVAGSEVIVACQLLPSQPCLLHCHAQAGSLAVWLRSSLPDLPDCLLYHCQKAIQES